MLFYAFVCARVSGGGPAGGREGDEEGTVGGCGRGSFLIGSSKGREVEGC